VATNVHHSNTPTAYSFVKSARVGVFRNGGAAIVTASRTENTELFESLFGGLGLTGVIVSLELYLRPCKLYKSSVEDYVSLNLKDLPSLALKACDKSSSNFVMGTFRGPGTKISARLINTMEEQDHGEAILSYVPTRITTCEIVRVVCGMLTSNGKAVVDVLYNKKPQCEGRFLDYYSSHSWDVGRSDPAPVPLKKGQVAIPASGLNDTSLQLPVQHLNKFTDVLCAHMQGMSSSIAFLFGFRIVPKSGGGILAMNADQDVVAVDFIRLGIPANESWFSGLMDKLHEAKVECAPHPGKAVVPHPLLTGCLSSSQRKRFLTVLSENDPDGMFDSGQMKLRTMYSFD